MKVIFLDFDGPILTRQSYERGVNPIKAWEPCVEQLNRITNATGAKIIVTSSWRIAGLKEIQNMLKSWGVTGECIDITPDLSKYDSSSGLYLSVTRGTEIQTWIDSSQNTIETFVIIDDENDMDDLVLNLIQTPFEVGITLQHAETAISMLQGESK